jgi:hypothetical protein
MVSFSVEPGGKLQYLPGAVFDAEATAFAAVFKDMYDADGGLDFFRIERNPP